MEQLAQDKNGFAFQTPFQPQGASPQGGGLRPFTAVDLAPQAKPGVPASLGPAVSPFLESYSSPFVDASEHPPLAPNPHNTPKAEDRPRAGFHGAEPSVADDYMPLLGPGPMLAQTPASSPAPAQNFPPAQHLPMPAAARQSQIMSASDLHSATGSAIKPRFFVTSTAMVDGYPIQAYLDVISVEIVLPKDLLFRNPAPYGELHRLKAAEEQLQRVKAKAMEELTDKAKQLRADGIVGVTVTFTNLDTVCCLCAAVGTAVKIA